MFSLIISHCSAKRHIKTSIFSECNNDNTWAPFSGDEEGRINIDPKFFNLGPGEFACLDGYFVFESKDKFTIYTGNESTPLQFNNPFYFCSNPDYNIETVKLTCTDNQASCKVQVVPVPRTDFGTKENPQKIIGLFTTRSNVKFGYTYHCINDDNKDTIHVATFGPQKRRMKFTSENPDVVGLVISNGSLTIGEGYDYILVLDQDTDGVHGDVKSKFTVTIEVNKSSTERECLFELEKTYVFPNDVVAASKEEVEENSKKYNFEIAPPSPTPQQTPQQTPKQTQKPPKLSKFALIIIISISCALVLLIVIFVIYVIIQRRKDVTKSDAAIGQQLV